MVDGSTVSIVANYYADFVSYHVYVMYFSPILISLFLFFLRGRDIKPIIYLGIFGFIYTAIMNTVDFTVVSYLSNHFDDVFFTLYRSIYINTIWLGFLYFVAFLISVSVLILEFFGRERFVEAYSRLIAGTIIFLWITNSFLWVVALNYGMPEYQESKLEQSDGTVLNE